MLELDKIADKKVFSTHSLAHSFLTLAARLTDDD